MWIDSFCMLMIYRCKDDVVGEVLVVFVVRVVGFIISEEEVKDYIVKKVFLFFGWKLWVLLFFVFIIYVIFEFEEVLKIMLILIY